MQPAYGPAYIRPSAWQLLTISHAGGLRLLLARRPDAAGVPPGDLRHSGGRAYFGPGLRSVRHGKHCGGSLQLTRNLPKRTLFGPSVASLYARFARAVKRWQHFDMHGRAMHEQDTRTAPAPRACPPSWRRPTLPNARPAAGLARTTSAERASSAPLASLGFCSLPMTRSLDLLLTRLWTVLSRRTTHRSARRAPPAPTSTPTRGAPARPARPATRRPLVLYAPSIGYP